MSDLVVPLVLLLVVLIVLGAVSGAAWWVLRRGRSADSVDAAVSPVAPGEAADPADAATPIVDRSAGERRQPRQARPVRRLEPAARERYLAAWRGVQSRFPESPVLALSEADTIVTSLLGELGFPLDDPRPSAELLPEQQARVLDGFRAGRAIEQANTSSRSDAEQVREGMQHFDRVFAAVLEGGAGPYPDGAAPQATRAHR